ncbi:uncharacterized protein [Physcomitrium patens]|uniref:uncharacterized protein n=1 Tax=Physcomitrium patens TaxID=3218 RepID=UPI003CCCC26E
MSSTWPSICAHLHLQRIRNQVAVADFGSNFSLVLKLRYQSGFYSGIGEMRVARVMRISEPDSRH